MSLKTEAIKRFLTAARSLANQGLSREAIMQFAKNEFGEITELFKRQIDNIFKRPASGIEKIKIKDPDFDDTVVKMQFDEFGPFNPKDPLKNISKQTKPMRYRGPDEFDTRKQYEEYLDAVLGPADEVFGNPLKNDLLKEFDKVKAKNITPKKTDDFNLSEDDPLGDLEKIIKGEGDTGLPKKPRDKKYTGGMVDIEPSLSDIGHGSDALMARTRLMSPGSQATTSTGLNYLLAEDNDNIRVPFSNGGGSDRMPTDYEKFLMQKKLREMQDFQNYMKNKDIEKRQHKFFEMNSGTGPGPILEAAEGGRIGFSKGKLADKGRRKFMQLAGTSIGGLAALKAGLINLAKDAGPKIEMVKETVSQTPQYFFDLVSKIKMFGKPGTSIGPRQNTMNYKNYELMEDVSTGDMRITKQAGDPDGPGYKEEVMEFNKGGNPMEEGITKESYEEATLFPDMDGKMKDIEDGIEPDSIKEIMEEITEVKTKKASGGIAKLLGE